MGGKIEKWSAWGGVSVFKRQRSDGLGRGIEAIGPTQEILDGADGMGVHKSSSLKRGDDWGHEWLREWVAPKRRNNRGFVQKRGKPKLFEYFNSIQGGNGHVSKTKRGLWEVGTIEE